MSDTRRVEVGVEVGPKRRVFAQAIGWPGWCRGGRREEDALEALAGHAGRYRAAMGPLASSLPSAPQLVVVERVDGDATTEFGAPGRAFLLDRRVLEPGEPDRLAEMLRAAWAALDSALAVNPEASRDVKPPVGRSPTGIWLHAGGAERAYLSPMLKALRTIGGQGADAIVAPRVSEVPTVEQIHQVRDTFVACVRALPVGVAFDGPFVGTARPAPYWVRRAAWHVLDHAWELEDRLAR